MGPISCKLEKLSVVGTNISNAALSWISRSATQLKCLNLSFSYGYDQDIVKSFPRLFPHLQNLYLSNTRLTEDALVVLANLYSLRVLDISNNLPLTPDTILAFRKMTSNRICLILERPIESEKYCCWWAELWRFRSVASRHTLHHLTLLLEAQDLSGKYLFIKMLNSDFLFILQLVDW